MAVAAVAQIPINAKMDITVKSQVARQAFAHHIQTVPMAVQIVNQPPGRLIPQDTKNVPSQHATQPCVHAVKKQNLTQSLHRKNQAN